MKKQNKFIIITGCIFALGILLSIIGAALGGSLSEASITEDNIKMKSIDKTMENTDDIKNLSFHLAASDVILKEGTTFSVKGNGITRCEIKNGTWYVSSKLKRSFSLFHLFPIHWNDRKITITFPSQSFKRVAINAKAIDCKIDNLICEDLEVSVAAGSVKIGNLQTNLADISLSAGDLKIQTYQIRGEADMSCHMGDIKLGSENTRANNLCNNLDVSCNMGDIQFYGKLTGENDVSVNMGSIKLMLMGTANQYQFSSNTIMGSVNSGDNETSSQTEPIYGTGDLSCTMGDIKVSYQRE